MYVTTVFEIIFIFIFIYLEFSGEFNIFARAVCQC